MPAVPAFLRKISPMHVRRFIGAWVSQRPVRQVLMIASAVVAITGSTWWALRNSLLGYGSLDLNVYVGAVRSWLIDGKPLYDYALAGPDGDLLFAYPPFAAVVMSPLAATSHTTTVALFAEVSLLALAAAVWWSVLPMVRKHSWNALYVWALAVPLAFALKPTWLTVGIGQINLILLLLVLTDFILLYNNSRFAGIGIGLAAAIKLTPLLFIVYLAATSRWRATFTAVASAAGATLVGFIVLPKASWHYFTHLIFDVQSISNMTRSPNQSLAGLVARVTDTTSAPTLPWLLLALPVVAFALWRARRAYLGGADLTGFCIVGLAAALASPISWTHHLVWIIPSIAVLIGAAVEGAGVKRYVWGALTVATFLLFASQTTMRYGDLASAAQLNNVGVLIVVDAYLIAMLVLVALLPLVPDKTAELKPSA